MACGPGCRSDLFADFLAQVTDLGRDPVLDVHAVQDGVVTDQHGGADQDDADGDEQDREADGVVAAADQHDDGGDRGQADAGPDQGREEAGGVRRLGVPVRHGGRCYREWRPSRNGQTPGTVSRCPASGMYQQVISRRRGRRPS
ncbi:hypothetical protein AFR_41415 [Actinoplanes friuliensis DSM 7358]|uniref:Uncharacterized protein n=1 Tax=Actinoplanes friuliensis DSM 7358 TaxID=1246995 RepID=U5WC38_9ACTN|nr:hypothetical protein AFR_41415 [Actinoplanes friuliensis DSM 7358]